MEYVVVCRKCGEVLAESKGYRLERAIEQIRRCGKCGSDSFEVREE